MDKVSIIVPVYNAEDYIDHTLSSILNQTYTDIEVVVINDGSKDLSMQKIKKYSEKDNRIKIIDRENKGVFFTRIEGLEVASSDYIIYVDADDWLEPNAVELLYSYLKAYDADIVRCSYYIEKSDRQINVDPIFHDTTLISKSNFSSLNDLLFTTSKLNALWGQIIKKTLYKDVEDLDLTVTTGEDILLNLCTFMEAKNILFIPNRLYHYAESVDSITRTSSLEKAKINAFSSIKVFTSLYKTSLQITNKEERLHYSSFVLYRCMNRIKENLIIIIRLSKALNEPWKELYTFIEKLLNEDFVIQANKKLTLQYVMKFNTNHKILLKYIYKRDIDAAIRYVSYICIPGSKIKNIIKNIRYR